MNGLDLVVFTGGIGENDPIIRERVGNNLSYLGMDFNPDANKGVRGKDVILTKPGSKVIMATVTTNEELVIARDTMNLAK
ncbi:Acetate kinase [bioreactor metagenome]|uniref:Acetate kinase n=1 Tax=bioreactor metagenome TaxID=1076179 RepID=A0A645D245_9ZZZZ